MIVSEFGTATGGRAVSSCMWAAGAARTTRKRRIEMAAILMIILSKMCVDLT
jgi:hypothetical protein